MVAEVSVSTSVELTGLGLNRFFQDRAIDGTTPTGATYNYRVLTITNIDEALDLGDVSTGTILAIRAIDKDLKVDLNYTGGTFRTSFTLVAGKPAALIPNPEGDIYVVNDAGTDTPAFEYLLIGTV